MLNNSSRQQSGQIQNFTYSQDNSLLFEVDFCLYHNFYLLSNRQCKKAHNEKCIFFLFATNSQAEQASTLLIISLLTAHVDGYLMLFCQWNPVLVTPLM